MFSVGFILSFAVSLSIIILAPPIKRYFSFLPQAFADSLGVLVAAQLASLPLMVSYFGAFSIVSFVANFLLLPIVVIIFYLSVVGMIVGLILPVFQPIALYLPKILILGVQGLTNILAKVLLSIKVFPLVCKIVYYPTLLVVSDLINLPKSIKKGCVCVLLIIIIYTLSVSFLV